MMKWSRSAVLLCLAVVAGGGYYWRLHAKPATASAAAESAQSQGGTNARKSTSDQVVSVVTTTAARGDFPVRRRSIGWIEPISTVAVKSRVQSQLLGQNFIEGQMVKEGDLLFTLDDREYQAAVDRDQATLEKDQAQVILDEANLTRNQQLLARNAGTQQAVDQALANEKSAVANVGADKAALETDKLHLSYNKIYAPISGRVGAVTVTPGNLVTANQTGPGFVTITQMQPIRATFTLPERNLAEIKAAAAGSVPPVVRVTPNGSGKSIAGTLDFIDSSVDNSSGTITLKAEFPNQDLSLWPGQYVDVEIDVGTHPNATMVPTVAVQIGQKGNYVFVVKPDQTVELRNITAGETEGDKMEVLAGLQPGEKVVTDGQANLMNGTHVREAKSLSDNQSGSSDNQGQKS